MNTNPDETTLALWLDDELTGEELTKAEAWASGNPEMLAAREENRRFRKMMSSALPASEEPPYAEFFNARVMTAIQREAVEPEVVETRKVSWRAVFMPLAACAGMVIAFVLGSQTERRGAPVVAEIDVTGAPKAIPVDPILYTPVKGVNAEWFSSNEASATVIVLNGVDAIPDEMDFSATASSQNWREIDSTAAITGGGTPDL